MKKINLLIIALTALTAQNVIAQDNDDTNTDQHKVEVTVPEVAILDIHDTTTGDDDATGDIISFDMTPSGESGNTEAGLYDFADIPVYNTLWLNYTSVVTGAETREITVDFAGAGSTFPDGMKLRITPLTSDVENPDNGTAGAIVAAGFVELNVDDLNAGTAAKQIVNTIGSVYTGNDANGVNLEYSLLQDGSFSDYKAGTYTTDVIYTLSDN